MFFSFWQLYHTCIVTFYIIISSISSRSQQCSCKNNIIIIVSTVQFCLSFCKVRFRSAEPDLWFQLCCGSLFYQYNIRGNRNNHWKAINLLSNMCILFMFILNRSTDFALGCNHFVNRSGGFGLLVRTDCLSSRSRTVICF
jgi:hypothetical protein